MIRGLLIADSGKTQPYMDSSTRLKLHEPLQHSDTRETASTSQDT